MCGALRLIAFVAALSLVAWEANGQVYIKVVEDNEGTRLETLRSYKELADDLHESTKELDLILNVVQQETIRQYDIHQKSLHSLRHLIAANTTSPTSPPSSCSEAMADGQPSGVYKITIPSFSPTPFPVYCLADPNGGPAWTLVQRRQDGSVDFFRGWYHYKRGFGDLQGEFWMGLEKLHHITNHQEHELWFHLEDFEGERADGRYQSFAIGDETSAYPLSVLGSFSGNASDSLEPHRRSKFTTRDHDNDNLPDYNCAIEYSGAWWYSQCFYSNLNGRYLSGKNGPEGTGVEWASWRHQYSLKYAHMAIRPV